MRPLPCICLIVTLLLAGQPFVRAAADKTVTIYRCVDAKGHVSLQDDPCPKDSQESARNMVRPQDAPARPVPPPPAPASAPEPAFVESYYPPPPPPPLYQCTSYDGIVRDSEVYDPNPRCEPLGLYYPDAARRLTPAQANACRWVQDSCVRLSDEQTCARFRQKKKEAASALLHTFSDTEAYRKSELQRLTQIVDESCR